MKANLPPALAACFAVRPAFLPTSRRVFSESGSPRSGRDEQPGRRPILGLRFRGGDGNRHAGILGELAEFGRAW